MHRLDLGIYSHPKGYGGDGVRTHVYPKGQFPSTEGSQEDGSHDTASSRTVSQTLY